MNNEEEIGTKPVLKSHRAQRPMPEAANSAVPDRRSVAGWLAFALILTLLLSLAGFIAYRFWA
jgi:hypothetical protein